MKGYADVPTLLLDGQALIESELLDLLTRAIVKPRPGWRDHAAAPLRGD
jgi:L-asparagine oxygenase